MAPRSPAAVYVPAVLIDATHKPWFLATAGLAALAGGLYLLAWVRTPGGPTANSPVGMAYGLAGAALMAYAGLLSLLRRVPSWWWLGPRKTWLRGHVWLGLLSGLLVLFHSGFRWGGPLEQVLWVVVGLTLVTGVAGLVLQQFLPRIITGRVGAEAPYEQIPHLYAALRERAETVVRAAGADPKLDAAARAELDRFYAAEVRPFLAAPYRRSATLASPIQAEALFGRVRALPGLAAALGPLAELEVFCDERRQLGEQERLHRWLHGWLLVHVPLAAVLLVLGLAHAVLSLYY